MTFCLMKELLYKFEDNMSQNRDTTCPTEHPRSHVNHGQRQNAKNRVTASVHARVLAVALDTYPNLTGSSTRKTKKAGDEPLP